MNKRDKKVSKTRKEEKSLSSKDVLIRGRDFIMMDDDLVMHYRKNTMCRKSMCIIRKKKDGCHYAVERKYYHEDEIPKDELIHLPDTIVQNPVQYGIIYNPYNIEIDISKVDPKNEIKEFIFDFSPFKNNQSICITRNGIPFYTLSPSVDHNTDMYQSVLRALQLIEMIKRHPLNFNHINYNINMIGRRVWYHSQPAIITKWIKKRGIAVLEPDEGMGYHNLTNPITNEELPSINVEFHDPYVYWHRD